MGPGLPMMGVVTGVTTSLLDARLVHDGELPQPEEDSGRLKMHHRARVCDFLHVHGAASSGRGNGDRVAVPDIQFQRSCLADIITRAGAAVA